MFLIEISSKENHFFTSMTNIHENFIYDSDGYLLYMETAQSNLSLFNISSDSLIFNEYEDLNIKSQQKLIKYSNSSIDIYLDFKRSMYHSTTILFEDNLPTKTNTLQRWKGLELLNTYA